MAEGNTYTTGIGDGERSGMFALDTELEGRAEASASASTRLEVKR